MNKKIIPDVIDLKEIYTIGTRIKNPLDKSLYYFLYLSGARISEALALKKEDISTVDDIGYAFLTTLKNKRKNFRELPIHIPGKFSVYETKMYRIIQNYMNSRVKKIPAWRISRTNIWHRFNNYEFYARGYHGKNIITNIKFGMFPHYLRHCRLTHLVKYYDLNIAELMNFAGWSSPAPASIYVHLTGKDLAEKMGRGSAYD